MSKTMRGRFAPSPTGQMHLGNAWTALLAWLQVRAGKGQLVLRMEDLDPDRSRAEYVEGLEKDLRWLGLDWEEGGDLGGAYGPYEQDKRRGLYEEALQRLRRQELIYPCYCTRAELAASAPHGEDGERIYQGTCAGGVAGSKLTRKPSLRLKVPEEEIVFEDGVYGLVRQNLRQECGDFVVRRSDGVHAYQLAVVVDDALMGITHVLRGADLLASTPRQLYLYRLLGYAAPLFSHVPLLVDEKGVRLSKRHGALAVAVLRERGVRAEKIIGLLAWLAGLLPTLEEAQPQELVNLFDLKKISRQDIIVSETAWRFLR
ncbi:tRNA glutamyl-Q(34) synthetase GluQRS [Anaeromusa acidaminophila]|uniref:tRNA glutamyl-Q(34) synthetase GluQRS n=1 Tax=Anaeromusa acidaminophila TaxID=81464 RepID=UPI0003AB3CED|nr:tRNA glutamyl-Q(34) synthetase GluQRS [Anaeromusa acidaminophila]